MRIHHPLCFLVLLLVSAPVTAASRDYDVVSMKNGDAHVGTVAQEAFELETDYGKILVPRGLVAKIRSTGANTVVLRTWEGERYGGRLSHDRLTMLRGYEATLQLAPADIQEADFAFRQTRLPLEPVADVIELQNGDYFRGRILTGDLLVKSDQGLRLIGRDDLFLVDVEPQDDPAGPRVRVQQNGNLPAVRGTLLTAETKVRNRFGNEITLPAAKVASLAVDVVYGPPQGPGELDIAFRDPLASAVLLRDRLRSGGSAPVLVALRGGPFRRGDLAGDGDSDERPARELRLHPFAIGVYEVTFDDYDRFCAATSRVPPDDEGWGRGRRPVVNVSWDDAQAYVVWLGGQTGMHYRLPTDAEWEYAARAGAETRYWWGDDLGQDMANCAGCGSLWDGERSAPVGRFPPNAFGLHDTAGNVFEWVADCWHDTYAEAPVDGSALETTGCGKRVIRGGAWSFPPKEIRSANRWRDFPERHSDDTGFRVARDPSR